jgi:ribonuclease J
MRLTIHRGSHQIGGTCIEIASGSSRIVLDAGLPLDADLNGANRPPLVHGLFDMEGAPVDGLFLSHSHADHSGLIAASRAQVPVWMSAGTSKMVMAGSLFARQPNVPRQRQHTIEPGRPVTIGPLRVTAYPVDHSVFDAMAFLVEAEGRRVLYTGDLRFHGRKPGMARQLARIAKAAPLDALLIEGTRLGDRSAEANFSEKDLETQLVGDFRVAPRVVLGMYSPLNVDRFVTYFQAARKAGRTLVIDPYQAFVLHLVGNQAKLPQLGTAPDLRLFIPPRFPTSGAARRLGHTAWFKRLGRGAITAEEIAETPERFVVLFRQSMQEGLFGHKLPHGVTCIFSYWPGYLKEQRLQSLVEAVKVAAGQFLNRHASGHAHPDDLRRFVEEANPRLLIPVHTTSPEAWKQWWPKTRIVRDSEKLDVR